MIERRCFSREWLESVKADNPGSDPALVERMIHAFELLGQLSKRESDFVFKGGTALVLLLSETRRVSVDIDISGHTDITTLDQIVEESVFNRWEEEDFDQKGIPKKHFKIFYDSEWEEDERFVWLDYIEEDHVYPKTDKEDIQTDFFTVESRQSVQVPTLEGLLADKLIAFSPETVGIPYVEVVDDDEQENSLRLIKQLYDVGVLFDEFNNLGQVLEAYSNIFGKQNSYQHQPFTENDSLVDTIKASRYVSMVNNQKVGSSEPLEVLEKGMDQIQSHVLTGNLSNDLISLYAARAAYLSAVLMNSEKSDATIEYYDSESDEQLKNVQLTGDFEPLNYIRGRNAETFYYWHKVNQIIGDSISE